MATRVPPSPRATEVAAVAVSMARILRPGQFGDRASPPPAMGDEQDASRRLVDDVDPDDEVVGGDGALHRLTPLDEQDTVGGGLGEVEVVEFSGGSEPVDVGVVHGKEALVSVDQDEGGAGHPLLDTETLRHPASEEGLARPETTGEQHDVPGAEQPGEALAGGERLGGRRCGDDEGGPGGVHRKRSSCSMSGSPASSTVGGVTAPAPAVASSTATRAIGPPAASSTDAGRLPSITALTSAMS